MDHFQTGMFRVEQLEQKRVAAGKSEALFLLGARLRAARKKLQLERKDIAMRCGTSPDELGRFEHALGDINFSTLKALCTELKLDLVQQLSECMDVPKDQAANIVSVADAWKGGTALKVDDVLNIAGADDSW